MLRPICLRPVLLSFAFLLFSIVLVAQPSISSFTPVSGLVGTSVTITGANFSSTPSNNIVYFGAVKANVTAATATSLTVIVPPGASHHPISVTVNGLIASSQRHFLPAFSGGGNIYDNSFELGATADNVTNMETNDIQVGDIDGDGLPDIAVVDRLSGKVSIYRNTSTSSTITLNPRVDFLIGGSTLDLVAGDVDGDGKPDLVITSRTNNNVSILRNTSVSGNISFAAPVPFATPSLPAMLAIGDLDKDGKLDLAVASFTGLGSMSTFRNTSTQGVISFAPRTDIALNVTVGKMLIADIDGDLKQDIAFTSPSFNFLSILRNTSTTGVILFASRVDFATQQYPRGIAIGDVDGDGMNDLGVTCFDANVVSIFRNTSASGTVSFANRVDIPTNLTPNSIAFGDIDGNGKVDMAVINDDTDPSSNLLSIFQNTSPFGGVSFGPKTDFPTVGFNGLLINDMDNDGKSDLIVCGSLFRAIVFKSKVGEPVINSFTPVVAGPGTTIKIEGVNFTGATVVRFGGTAATSFSVVNSNTINAVVGPGASGNVEVTTAFGTATKAGFTFTSVPLITSFSPSIAGPGSIVTISGANLQGATGVTFGGVAATSYAVVSPTTITAVVGTGASGDVGVLFPSGPVFKSGFNFTNLVTINGFSPASGPTGSQVTIEGANFSTTAASNLVHFGDVRATVISATPGTLVVSVPIGASYHPITVNRNGAVAFSRIPFVVTVPNPKPLNPGSFAEKVDYSLDGPSTYGVGTGDLDGDGKTDMYATRFDANKVSIYRNSGTLNNISFEPRIDSTGSGQPTATGMADIDGDGKKDLIAVNFSVSVYKNNGTPGTISVLPKSSFSVTGLPQSFAVGDLTPDGKPDIAVGGYTQLSVLVNSTSGPISFLPAIPLTAGLEIQGTSIGDINGDGLADLAVLNHVSNTLSVLTNSSTTSTLLLGSPIDLSTPSGPKQVKMGDLDGDGKLDIVVSNFQSSVSVFRNTSSNGIASFDTRLDLATGSQARGVSLGDLNGDGKVDIVAVNAMSNSISVIQNNSTVNNLSFSPRIDIPTANFPQDAALADFDGDGSLDIAVTCYSGAVSVFRNTSAKLIIHNFTPAAGTTGTIVTINGNNFTGATAVRFGGVDAQSFTVHSSSKITAEVAAGATGEVTVVTPMGTISMPGFTYHLPPTITSFTPGSGNSGASIVITGTNFTGVTSVKFGTFSSSNFVVNNPTTITASPSGLTTGTVNISVTTPGGTAIKSGFLFYAAPVIQSFNPVQSGTNGLVDIVAPTNFGSFTDATAVTFGGVPATAFVVVNDKNIRAVVGVGASGEVKVTTPGGTTALSGFTYLSTPSAAPGILSFSPTIAGPGMAVTITGVNLGNVNSVIFGGTNAASFSIVNANTIVAIVGNGSSGFLKVTNPAGSSSIAGFIFHPAPTITSFSPTSGISGTVVTITGTNLVYTTDVTFGGVSATSVILQNPTTLKATVGTGATGDVKVISTGGVATMGTFTYLQSPTISSFSPTSGGAGTIVTISGSGFTGATAVSFGGTPASSFVVVNSTTITAVVSSGASGNVSVTTPGGTVTLAGFTFNPVTNIGNPNINSPELTVNPNPGKSIITIHHPKVQASSYLSIFDFQGRTVYQATRPKTSEKVELDITTWPAGVYQIVWTDNRRMLVRTLLK